MFEIQLINRLTLFVLLELAISYAMTRLFQSAWWATTSDKHWEWYKCTHGTSYANWAGGSSWTLGGTATAHSQSGSVCWTTTETGKDEICLHIKASVQCHLVHCN